MPSCVFSSKGLLTLIWFVVLLENKTVLYKGSNCTLKMLVPPHPALLSSQYSLKATLYSRYPSKALWLKCYDKSNQNEIQDLIITKCRRFSRQRREIKSKWKTGKYLDLAEEKSGGDESDNSTHYYRHTGNNPEETCCRLIFKHTTNIKTQVVQ